jgi:RNA polymerase sigma-70 factor (ECF subfamily)
VFDFDYAEIAKIVDKSEVNCRQLLTRAKKHIGEPRARFDVDPTQADRLLNRFTEATRAGDIESLLGLLAEDITLWADGGGKVPGAALQPVRGAESVARFLVQRARGGAARGGTLRPTRINGQPGFVVYVNGEPQAALVLGIRDARIHDIYAIANPDKLHALSTPAQRDHSA